MIWKVGPAGISAMFRTNYQLINFSPPHTFITLQNGIATLYQTMPKSPWTKDEQIWLKSHMAQWKDTRDHPKAHVAVNGIRPTTDFLRKLVILFFQRFPMRDVEQHPDSEIAVVGIARTELAIVSAMR